MDREQQYEIGKFWIYIFFVMGITAVFLRAEIIYFLKRGPHPPASPPASPPAFPPEVHYPFREDNEYKSWANQKMKDLYFLYNEIERLKTEVYAAKERYGIYSFFNTLSSHASKLTIMEETQAVIEQRLSALEKKFQEFAATKERKILEEVYPKEASNIQSLHQRKKVENLPLKSC